MATIPEPTRPAAGKSPEQVLRELLNQGAVVLISKGFDTIDHLSDGLKKALLRGISSAKEPPA